MSHCCNVLMSQCFNVSVLDFVFLIFFSSFIIALFSSSIQLFSDNFFIIKSDQILLVIIIIVFLKSTVLPFESVNLQSSRICNNILNTSG